MLSVAKNTRGDRRKADWTTGRHSNEQAASETSRRGFSKGDLAVAKEGCDVHVCVMIASHPFVHYSACYLVRMELSISDGIIMREKRIFPSKLQQKNHQNRTWKSPRGSKNKVNLRETVWFPGIDRKVEQAVNECLMCQAATRRNSKP